MIERNPPVRGKTQGKKEPIPPIPYAPSDKRYEIVYRANGGPLRSSILAADETAAIERLRRHLGDVEVKEIKEVTVVQ